MKKIISVILALACIMCVFASCGDEAEKEPQVLTSGDYSYVVLEDGTVKITKYNGTQDVLEMDIPAEIDGKTVTIIGKESFVGATGLTIVNFPEGLLTIEERAFADSSVKKVFLNDSRQLKEIPTDAFRNCLNLVQVDLPSSLEAIRDEAFCYCLNLLAVTFRGNPEEIEPLAFDACEKMTIYTKDGMDNVVKFANEHDIEYKIVNI